MDFTEVKSIIKRLGLNGKEFSSLLGHNTNYVSNFSRDGVPTNIAITLRLSDALLESGVKSEKIVGLIADEIRNEKGNV